MHNKINNNTHFQGGFLINYRTAVKGTQEALEKKLYNGCGKQIFRNWKGKENQVLYVLRDSKDYETARFINLNKLKFKYYPELNTKLRFDVLEPEKVIQYIKKHKPSFINKFEELMDFIQKNRFKNRYKKDSNIAFYKRLLNKMKININGISHTDCRGVTKIADEKSEKIAFFSPLTKYRLRYVYIVPKSGSPIEKTKFYIIDEHGEIIEKIDHKRYHAFVKGFNDAIKHHLHLD